MIVLASGSPQRKKLMEDIGLEFIVDPSYVDESEVDPKLKPTEQIVYLATKKASIIAKNHPGAIVVGADTIIVHENEILGKPKDEEDAYRMLKRLSGDRHRVYTAVALVKDEKTHTFVSETEVSMKPLSDLAIHNYIQTKEPMDKAGAYGIQGEGGNLIENYKGDFFTIVGLPLKDLMEALKKFKDE